jgi:hypothetical protein
VQIIFALGTILGITIGAVADPAERSSVQTFIAIPLLLLATGAGVLLWRGSRAGLALSFGLQLFQAFPVIVDHTVVRFVCGFQWTLRFGGPRIWKPWGFEGTFIAMHALQFPDTMIGLNVVALILALYLASRLRDSPRPIIGDSSPTSSLR